VAEPAAAAASAVQALLLGSAMLFAAGCVGFRVHELQTGLLNVTPATLVSLLWIFATRVCARADGLG